MKGMHKEECQCQGCIGAVVLPSYDELKTENARLQVALDTAKKEWDFANEQYIALKKQHCTLLEQQIATTLALAGAREALDEICWAQPQRDGQWNPTLKSIAARALSTLPNNAKAEAMLKVVEIAREINTHSNKTPEEFGTNHENYYSASNALDLKLFEAVEALNTQEQTTSKAPNLTRIAACVKAAVEYKHAVDNYNDTEMDMAEEKVRELASRLTPEDHAWVERVGGV